MVDVCDVLDRDWCYCRYRLLLSDCVCDCVWLGMCVCVCNVIGCDCVWCVIVCWLFVGCVLVVCVVLFGSGCV